MTKTKADLTKLYAARLRLANRYPFLSQGLFAMRVVVEPRCLTMAVDEYWRLYVNPDLVDRSSIDELEAIVYHELLHLLWDHHGRSEAMNARQKLFNVATDCEINDNIREQGLAIPGWVIFPKDFDLPDGLLAEEYYARLLPQVPQVEIVLAHKPEAAQDGSGAGGEAGEWEQGPGPDAMTPGSGEVVRQAVAQAVLDHAQKSRGDVPGGLQRWAESRLSPKIDWRKALRSAIRQGLTWTSGMVDYHYDRPSRRQAISPDIVLPRLRAPQPEVALIIDTSGSMSDADLTRALAEVGGVLRATGGPVDVLAGDVGAQATSRVLRPEQVALVGGGGTDMGQALEDLAATGKRYGLVVVLTDGYTPWCHQNPLTCPILVVLVNEHGPEGPPWATTIRVTED